MDDKQLIQQIKEKFKKVLGERLTNTMGVEGVFIKSLWRPNNYRLTMIFNKDTFKPTHPKKPLFPVEIKSTNYGSKFIQKTDERTTIMVDKTKITCIYSLKDFNYNKIWYLIEAYSLEDIEKRIIEKVNDIKSYCIQQINRFTKVYGGRAIIDKAYWSWYEDGLHTEEYLDKISREYIVHDTIFKKVYKDEIEFRKPKGQLKGEPALHLKNTITNLAIKNTAPELIKEIQDLKLFVLEDRKQQSDIMNQLSEQIKSHLNLI